MDLHFTLWDWLLMAVVSGQTALMAYLHHPRWKAVILSLPVPFSVACLSVGRPLDVTNVAGFMLFLAYMHGVRILYRRWRVPIVAAILLAAAGYSAAAMILAPILPAGAAAFWIGLALTLLTAFGAYRLFPHCVEPGHRTALPVWIKVPLIVGIVFVLICAKRYLQGFMTVFPMVSLIGAYEARHSLGTACRQVPVFIAIMVPMLVVMRLSQAGLLQWGAPLLTAIGLSLVLGWIVFLLILIPIQRWLWRRDYRLENGDDPVSPAP